jgi:hypothetical protein
VIERRRELRARVPIGPLFVWRRRGRGEGGRGGVGVSEQWGGLNCNKQCTRKKIETEKNTIRR